MATLAVEPVIAAITAIVTGAVEKGTEAAVMATISAAVTEAVEAAVTAAITAAITAGVVSAVSGTITANTTLAVEQALQNKLKEAVKDVIGSQGVKDIAKAITAIPSEEVVNKLTNAALKAINPYLWVFRDPTFLRLTKLIRALRAVKKGKKPEDEDDNDDDCDEEKCRYFDGRDVAEFIFFTVFGSSDCKEGDEVYSMSTQQKNLESLLHDPVGGHFVSQLLEELCESCVDVDETDSSLSDGISNLADTKVMKKIVKGKFVKIATGKMIPFGNKTIYNVKGTSQDKREKNWLQAYLVTGYGKCGKCYIATEYPVCGHSDPLKGRIVGGHMWTPAMRLADKSLYYYILPICKRHNKRIVYDNPDGGWLKTTEDAMVMQIKSTSSVPGWKGPKLFESKSFMLMAVESTSKAGECHEITQPKQLTDWLLEEVHKIALDFAKDPIDTVFKEVSATVLGKLNEIIKKAGEDTLDWVKSEGHDIMLQSLIPFYGIYQAIKRLSSLQSDAINKFHSGAQSALANYKNECLGDAEQARRKQRLSEETDKVISSNKWKDRLVAFETTVAEKVPSFVTPEI